MGTMYELWEDEKRSSNHVCLLCGFDPSAYWWGWGSQRLYICRKCAVEALPALIADATLGHLAASVEDGKRIVLEIEKNFWRAVALRKGRIVNRGAWPKTAPNKNR